MSTATIDRTATDYKVADLSLADWGRKEISIAEHEMPGLMSIRRKYAAAKPLAGVRITGSLHMTIQTAVLIETLVELGGDVRWASCNIFSTQDHAAAAIAKAGVPVFAWKGESLEEYWWCTAQALDHGEGKGPQLVVDDGGDVTLLIHKGYELENGDGWVNTPSSNHEEQVIKDLLKKIHAEDPKHWHAVAKEWRGVSEETTTGVHRLVQDEGTGQAPGSGDQRQRFRHQVEVRQSVWLPRIAGRRHQARHGRDGGGQSSRNLRLWRRGQGFGSLSAWHGRAGSGHRDRPHQRPAGSDGRFRSHHRRGHTRPRRYLCNLHRQCGRADSRAHVADEGSGHRLQHWPLRQRNPDRSSEQRAKGVEKVNVKPQVDQYNFAAANGKPAHTIFVLAEGRLVNLGCATGHPSFVMSNSFANQTLAQLDLWKNKDTYKIDVYTLPKHLDEEVARLHLEKIGVKLTTLTPAQANYLGVPPEGPYKPDTYRY